MQCWTSEQQVHPRKESHFIRLNAEQVWAGINDDMTRSYHQDI